MFAEIGYGGGVRADRGKMLELGFLDDFGDVFGEVFGDGENTPMTYGCIRSEECYALLAILS